MLFAFCGLAIVILLASMILKHLNNLNRRQSFLLSKIPSPRKFPLIHNVWIFQKINLYEMLAEFESLKKKLGSVFHFTLYPFHSGLFIVTDPVAVKHLLFKIHNPVKPSSYKILKGWLGEGLFASSGEKWQKRHRLIITSMSSSMMNKYVTNMNIYNDKVIKILRSKSGQPTELKPLVTNLTLDIIFESALGSPINALDNPRSSYVTAIEKMCEIIFERTFNPLKMIDFFYSFTSTYREEKKVLKVLRSLSKNVIKARRKELKATASPAERKPEILSLLDILLLSDDNLSDRDVTEEINSFIHGGHDTTASVVLFLLFNLAKYRDVQQIVYDEIKSLIYYDGDHRKSLTVNDLGSLKYLEAVITETLRLYPSVPFYGRHLTEEITAGDYTYPKGAEIFFSPYLMGRDADNYPEPLIFNPNRFLDKRDHDKLCNIQFSGGTRPCIGKKFAILGIKTLVSKLLINFELALVNENDEMTAVMGLGLTPKDPIDVYFIERREKCD